jgi:hypothetical protein
LNKYISFVDYPQLNSIRFVLITMQWVLPLQVVCVTERGIIINRKQKNDIQE